MVQQIKHFQLFQEADTLTLGKKLSHTMCAPLVVFLHGDLGAGKTTFSRGLIQALGHKGTVKSPTYTLVETYQFESMQVFHFDLYRLSDPEELEYMGIRDYFGEGCLCLVEWPEKGYGFLPRADLELTLQHDKLGRQVSIQANSEKGQLILERLEFNAG